MFFEESSSPYLGLVSLNKGREVDGPLGLTGPNSALNLSNQSIVKGALLTKKASLQPVGFCLSRPPVREKAVMLEVRRLYFLLVGPSLSACPSGKSN